MNESNRYYRSGHFRVGIGDPASESRPFVVFSGW